jgi:hypothetical protein
MSKKDLSLKPVNLKIETENKISTWWFYEEPKGIHVHRALDADTNDIVIPWRLIRKSLSRKDKDNNDVGLN